MSADCEKSSSETECGHWWCPAEESSGSVPASGNFDAAVKSADSAFSRNLDSQVSVAAVSSVRKQNVQ